MWKIVAILVVCVLTVGVVIYKYKEANPVTPVEPTEVVIPGIEIHEGVIIRNW